MDTCALCFAEIASQVLLSKLNILLCTQVTATGYSNIAQGPQLTFRIINYPACDSMCMHALAQLSALVILQLEAGWASATDNEVIRSQHNISLEGPRYHRCSPPVSLGLLQHLHVLRFVNSVHWRPLF